MKFYTTERVGKTRSRTPEGFLLCEGVPVARTGMMIYGPGEVPIAPGPDGLIRVERDEEQLFAVTFLASLNGKSVVNNHPDDDVTPLNWKEVSCGIGMNPRRGSGIESDLLIMDLLITDKDAISLVESGKDEISLGYEAEYEEIERGRGRQTDLIGNHIALVDNGRCGPRCAIGDHQPEGVTTMAKANTKDKKHRISDALAKLMTAFKAKDEKAAGEAAEELEKEVRDEAPEGADGEGTIINIHTSETKDDDGAKWEKNDADHEEFRKRLDAIEAKIGKTADADPDPDDDKKKTEDDDDPEKKAAEEKQKAADELLEEEGGKGASKAKDSNSLVDSWQQTISLAEILVPGMRVPTFDAAMDPHKTLDAMCRHRRNALDLAYATPDGRGLLDEVNGNAPFDLSQMSCKAVKTMFIAAGTAKKALNNATQHRTGDISRHQQQKEERKAPRTLAELNDFNRKHYQ